MILNRVTVGGFGCFADPVSVGPFSAGVNVLYGPNGTGKSTLCRGVAMALVDGHRVRSADMQALKPWTRGLYPEITVELQHGGHDYRVTKRFLDQPSSALLRKEAGVWRKFADGDDADAMLRDWLKSTAPGSGLAKPKHWGLAQVLWTVQGDVRIPELAADVVESIQRAVGAQLTSSGSVIETKLKELYLTCFQPGRGELRKGKNAPLAVRLAAEHERLLQEHDIAAGRLCAFDAEAEHVEDLRETVAKVSAERDAFAGELDALKRECELYEKLTSDRAERLQRKRAAESDYQRIQQQIDDIRRYREEIRVAREEAAAVGAILPGANSAVTARAEALAAAQKTLDAAYALDREAQAAEATAREAREYTGALRSAADIRDRLARATALGDEITSIRQEMQQTAAPSPEELGKLRSTTERHNRARTRVELARVTAQLEPAVRASITVVEGEEPGVVELSPGVPVSIAGSPNLVMDVPAVGRVRITGAAADYPSARRDLQTAEQELAAFAQRFGSSDADELQRRREQVAQLEARIKELTIRADAALGGASLEALKENGAVVDAQISRLAHAHPEWAAAAPDEAALTRDAAVSIDTARQAIQAAQAAMQARQNELHQAERIAADLASRSTAAAGRLATAGAELARREDGSSDEARQAALRDASMDRDACLAKLADVEEELKAWPQSPAGKLSIAQQRAARLDSEVQGVRDTLLRSEGRVAELAAQSPHTRRAEIDEQLAAQDQQLGREQLRMNALKLLWSTMAEVKQELLEAVSSPVEQRATSYLEEICGVPLASIKLTSAFATEEVSPVELEDAPVSIERMSGGEREQIHLCTRLALASEFCREERQFLVLDDVLTFTDNERMPRIHRLLERLSERMQIFVLTCHPERFLGMPGANFIDLAEIVKHAPAGVVA